MRAEAGLLRAELALQADQSAHHSAQEQTEYQIPVDFHIRVFFKKVSSSYKGSP